MKYTPTRLQSMAGTLMRAKMIGDPRWNQFCQELSKRTGIHESSIYQVVEALVKDSFHHKKNTGIS